VIQLSEYQVLAGAAPFLTGLSVPLREVTELPVEMAHMLAACSRLESLTVYAAGHIEDIGALAAATNLRSLNLSSCMKLSAADLAPLATMVNLESLTLRLRSSEALRSILLFPRLKSLVVNLEVGAWPTHAAWDDARCMGVCSALLPPP
jgi:hypothetical protein